MRGGGDREGNREVRGKRREVVILSLLLTSFFHSSGSLYFRKLRVIWGSIHAHLKFWSR